MGVCLSLFLISIRAVDMWIILGILFVIWMLCLIWLYIVNRNLKKLNEALRAATIDKGVRQKIQAKLQEVKDGKKEKNQAW